MRTPLAGFFSVLLLLEVHPELGIGPILIGAGAQVLRDIPAGEDMAIIGLEGQLAIQGKVRPNDVQFVANCLLMLFVLEKI